MSLTVGSSFYPPQAPEGLSPPDQSLKEEDMSSMSDYLKRLESCKDLEVSIILKTKIRKVLKMIVKLNFILRDEEFQFRKRGLDMLSRTMCMALRESANGG